jgi:hypothetical protein
MASLALSISPFFISSNINLILSLYKCPQDHQSAILVVKKNVDPQRITFQISRFFFFLILTHFVLLPASPLLLLSRNSFPNLQHHAVSKLA